MTVPRRSFPDGTNRPPRAFTVVRRAPSGALRTSPPRGSAAPSGTEGGAVTAPPSAHPFALGRTPAVGARATGRTPPNLPPAGAPRGCGQEPASPDRAGRAP